MSHVWHSIQSVWKSKPSHDSPHGRETTQMFTVWQKFQNFQQLTATWEPYTQQQKTISLFKAIYELKLHVLLHTGAKPYPSRHCSECFTRSSRLKTHLKSHNEGSSFPCHVIHVRRNSVTVVNLRHIYLDMKWLRRTFVMIVQSISTQQLNWDSIIQCIQSTNSFPVVFVIDSSNTNAPLWSTSRSVLVNAVLLTLCCDIKLGTRCA